MKFILFLFCWLSEGYNDDCPVPDLAQLCESSCGDEFNRCDLECHDEGIVKRNANELAPTFSAEKLSRGKKFPRVGFSAILVFRDLGIF